MSTKETQVRVEAFIKRWQGQERANYGMFLVELCDLLGMSHPDTPQAQEQESGREALNRSDSAQ
ncbi:hypothetical protein DUT91_22690 [Phyllobacterium salinisoli]|uniref:Uncharacterized protein n=1 Tax=Phyllobacterium salinisoli TaxID=1899321 RepID=A0A368JXK4_9HYPH|nr:hypothetical protein DUT91_22690 [Phyllobacterium salinisoli]